MKPILILLWAISILLIGFGLERADFHPLFLAYSIAFFNYGLLYQRIEDNEILNYIWVAFILRGAMIFSFPHLSDDIYRFIWDGNLIWDGIHPFLHTPDAFLQTHRVTNPMYSTLYPLLNSPHYFTVYPPVCQTIFAIATQLFPNSIYGSAVWMKLILGLFDMGSILLIQKILKQNTLPAKNVLLYALNPLIIIELCGNAHFEAAMIFFFLLGIYYWNQQKMGFAAIALAFSIASKLLPLLFVPFFVFWSPQSDNTFVKNIFFQTKFLGTLIISIFLLFLPLYNTQLVENMGTSLNLYFQKFEFNASIYYVLRWIGFQILGYNPIAVVGPALGIIVFLTLFYWVFWGKRTLYQNFLWSITLYLLCATIVHPWYLTLPIAISVLTNERFPILWSFLIFGTYMNYSYNPYYENLWIVAAEYITLILFVSKTNIYKKNVLQ
jgi:alpha-1,6-mannosyltransferase